VSAAGSESEACVKNLSEGGLLVSLREPVALGSAVRLLIERRGALPLGFAGEVVRVDRVPGQAAPGFDVGVRFSSHEAPAEKP
jgi:Tfp pilus assembly protein PilZ